MDNTYSNENRFKALQEQIDALVHENERLRYAMISKARRLKVAKKPPQSDKPGDDLKVGGLVGIYAGVGPGGYRADVPCTLAMLGLDIKAIVAGSWRRHTVQGKLKAAICSPPGRPARLGKLSVSEWLEKWESGSITYSSYPTNIERLARHVLNLDGSSVTELWKNHPPGGKVD